MRKYIIYGGKYEGEDVDLPCHGEVEGEFIDVVEIAINAAMAEYDVDPFRTIDDIMEEEDVSYEVAMKIYSQEREDAIDYFVEPVDQDV